MFSRIKTSLIELFYALLTEKEFRYLFVRCRFFFLKRNLRFYSKLQSENFDKKIVDYNLAFHPAAFGCGGRMAICLFPLLGLIYPNYHKKILIVGPRTEDDIFFAKSFGFKDVRGLDLFSYSPLIDIGDAHKTEYPKNHFDAVILSWVLPYTKTPDILIAEMKRILKNEGFLVVSWHWMSDRKALLKDRIRGNTINDPLEVKKLIGGKIQVEINPTLNVDHYKAFFSRIIK